MDLLSSLSSIYSHDKDTWTLYPGHKDAHTVDIQKAPNGAITFDSARLNLTDKAGLSSWLKKPATTTIPGNRVPTAKILLLEISDAPSESITPKTRQAWRLVVEETMSAFGLPTIALSHLVSWVPGFLQMRDDGVPPTTPTTDADRTYGLFQLSLNFIWSYSHEQHLTQGIIWYEERVHPLRSTLRDLENLRGHLEQPMYLGLVSCLVAERKIVLERRELISKVQRVDLQIGQTSGYEYLGDQAWEDDPVEMSTLSTLVSEVSSLTVRLKYRMRAVANFTTELVEENQKTTFRTGAASPANHSLRQQADGIDETLQRMGRFATQLLDHADGLQERTASQMTQLLNLTTQQDQRYSRLLAVEGKRDSSSMKTLAAVTMVFLPGTFVASFFATPFFDWNTERVVQPRFWIYWAVTIPLTIVTLAAWLLWSDLKAARESREDKTAFAGKGHHGQKNAVAEPDRGLRQMLLAYSGLRHFTHQKP